MSSSNANCNHLKLKEQFWNQVENMTNYHFSIFNQRKLKASCFKKLKVQKTRLLKQKCNVYKFYTIL